MAKAEKETRTRNWTFIVYPESAPSNWLEVLADLQIPFVVSPLHDRDTIPTGEQKKPHWHVVFLFSGVKSYEQVKDLPKVVNATIPERVKDIRAMVRYMTHIDYPSKAQYDKKDIKLYCGADVDIDSYFLTKSDVKQSRRELFSYMKSQNITEFADLVDYAEEFRPDWYDIIVESDFMMIKYIESNRHRQKERQEEITEEKEQEIEQLAEQCLDNREE